MPLNEIERLEFLLQLRHRNCQLRVVLRCSAKTICPPGYINQLNFFAGLVWRTRGAVFSKIEKGLTDGVNVGTTPVPNDRNY